MADSSIAIIESTTSSLQSTSNMALSLPSVSLSADIQVENLAITAGAACNNSQGLGIIDEKSSATNNSDNDGETEKKKRKLSSSSNNKKSLDLSEKLENRLGGILSCAVCLDLPRTAIFQCQMGHLMCAACFTHLLADGRLRDQVATCPNCRVEISKTSATRNLAVEKAVSELPNECQFCGDEYPNRSLKYHQENHCEERPTNCRYSRIGCQWVGPVHEVKNHEADCIHPHKTGAEVMSALEENEKKHCEEKKLFSLLIDLLSYEKIIFNDLQLKPYRTDEYVHKLYYETAKFSAFNHQWAVKARINDSQKDPHHSNERVITYQLILKTKTTTPLQIHYFVLKGPFSDIKLNTKIYKKNFSDEENESEYLHLPLPDSSECNRVLSAKTINMRLIMFLLSK